MEEEEEEGLEGARCVVASPSAAIVFLEGRNAAGLRGQVCVNVPRVPTIILTHTHARQRTHTHARQKTHTHATQQTKTHPAQKTPTHAAQKTHTRTHKTEKKYTHTHKARKHVLE